MKRLNLNNQKAFTLIEVLVSVVLFFIITFFLYQTLDMSKKTNKFYDNKLVSFETKNNMKLCIYEDISNAHSDTNTSSDTNITNDKNDNTILKLHSDNTFHNPFYTNITYFLGKNNELLRVESKLPFDEQNLEKALDNSYIDVLSDKVTKFKVITKDSKKNNKQDANITNNQNFIVYLKLENKEDLFITK